ncbi:MAG: hypothetical protein APR54_02285 [Candidatus Cloacimonas sp. SDB]|nr:MAG: hypothetical protein APR54_02285 [Candidatus Cloacimonas sp. SDB]
MAGVMLLVAKSPEKTAILQQKIQQLEQFIKKHFSSYFKEIEYLTPDQNSFMVIFKKDNESKFHQDKSGNWLAYEGNVFALHETKQYSAQELLQLYLKHGNSFAETLDGHFVIKVYNKIKGKYFIITDFIRSRINYFAESEEFFFFTPFILLTGKINKPQPDLNALNELLWRYYILSERTIFKNVTRLDSASIYELNNKVINISRYWNFPTRLTNLNLKTHVDKFVNSILETARLINKSFGKAVMDLTQGQDSRIIMSAFKTQNLPFSTSTFGKKEFLELKNVKKMADKYHFEHHCIEITNEFTDNILEYFNKSLILGNADEPGYLLGRILYMRDIQSEFGNVLVNGTGGPFYKDCFWEEVYALQLYRETYKINLNRFLRLRPMNKNYPDQIFNNNFLEIKNNSAEYFTKMIYDSIKNISSCPVSMQIDKFALTKWQNYAVVGNNIALSTHNSMSPLLLRRNLEIGLPMPAKWRWNKSNFQRKVMYKLDPDLAHEKTDFGGINMVPYNLFTFLPFYFKYVLRQTQRYRNKLLNRIGLQVKTHLQTAWDYEDVYRKLFEEPEIQELLEYDKMVLAVILVKDEWSKFLKRFNEPGTVSLNDYEFIFKLASVEKLFRLMK